MEQGTSALQFILSALIFTRASEQVARFRKQRAAESKLQEIRERKERRRRSMQATAKAATVEHGEENLPDEDDEEEREVNSFITIATGCFLIGVCIGG